MVHLSKKLHMQSIIHMEARIMQALPIPFPTTLLSMVIALWLEFLSDDFCKLCDVHRSAIG